MTKKVSKKELEGQFNTIMSSSPPKNNSKLPTSLTLDLDDPENLNHAIACLEEIRGFFSIMLDEPVQEDLMKWMKKLLKDLRKHLEYLDTLEDRMLGG